MVAQTRNTDFLQTTVPVSRMLLLLGTQQPAMIYRETDFVSKVTQSVPVAYGKIVQSVCVGCYADTVSRIASL
jgi:hypothetical protein